MCFFLFFNDRFHSVGVQRTDGHFITKIYQSISISRVVITAAAAVSPLLSSLPSPTSINPPGRGR